MMAPTGNFAPERFVGLHLTKAKTKASEYPYCLTVDQGNAKRTAQAKFSSTYPRLVLFRRLLYY